MSHGVSSCLGLAVSVLSTRGSSHSECHNSPVGRDDYTGEETETQSGGDLL